MLFVNRNYTLPREFEVLHEIRDDIDYEKLFSWYWLF